MVKDYRRLWQTINTIDEAKTIQTLTEILVNGDNLDKAGEDFVSSFGPEDTKLCIEILDRVCPDLHLFLYFAI